MILEFKDYKLDIDLERTEKFYSETSCISDDCDCADCRNYMEWAVNLPEKVMTFMKRLGIDPIKATEVYVNGRDEEKKIADYGGFYHICGEILETGENEAFFEICEGCSVAFTKDVSLKEDCLTEPCFQMEIDFSCVPLS